MRLQPSFLVRSSGAVGLSLVALSMALTALDASRGWILVCGALGLLLALVAPLASARHEAPSDQVRGASDPGAPEPQPGPDKRSRGVAESLPALIWIMNAEGRAVFQNQRASDYAGAPLGDLMARGS